MYPIINLIPLQEQLIKYCSDKSKIKTKFFLPVIKVWRPNEEPNIKSISKIFLYMLIRALKVKIYGNKNKA